MSSKSGKINPEGLKCCQTIRVSASSMMKTFQPLAIGLYEAMGGKINNRLVYKHVKSKFNFPGFFWLQKASFKSLNLSVIR